MAYGSNRMDDLKEIKEIKKIVSALRIISNKITKRELKGVAGKLSKLAEKLQK